jgi:CDP-diacylglycerol--serine O-phosphatidyltransferase
VVSSVVGMIFLFQGNVKFAILFLMLSGFCDMFDVKWHDFMIKGVKGKGFGIQIDSLCDVISFGFFPALINYQVANLSAFSDYIAYKIIAA